MTLGGSLGCLQGSRKPRTGGSKAENWGVESREMEGQKQRNGGSKAENWVPPRDSALTKRYTHAGSSTCRSPGVTPMRVPAPAAHQALLPCGFQHLPLTRRYSHAGPGACHSPDATPMRVPCSAHPKVVPNLGSGPSGQKPRNGESKAENWGVKSRELGGRKPRIGGPKPRKGS